VSPDKVDPLMQVFFEEAAERLADAEDALLQLEKNPEDNQLLNRIFRCAHTLKSNSALLDFQEIAQFTHTLEDLLDQLRNRRRPVTPEVIDTLLAAQDIVRLLLAHARGSTQLSAGENEVRQRVLGSIQALSKPEAVESAKQIPRSESKADISLPVKAGDSDPGITLRRASDQEESLTIRVPIERVDRLVNLVGELVISQSIVLETVNSFTMDKLPLLKDAVSQLDRHARELHERLMAVRMVPMKQLFGRFPRLIRDLSAATGKPVTLRMSGEDTELDKTVIEKVTDPLTHLVRNAVDHGLELPEERAAAGKSPEGVVEVKAYQQGGNIYVEVVDDGRGIDLERVRESAASMGLIRPDETLSEEAALELLFQPGISTATRVSEISGRGVGMDVVRRNLEALGGSIAIQSTAGAGTRFRIRLPLTVAIMDGQTVRVGDHVFLLPLTAIVESIRPEAGSVHSVTNAGEVVMVRGQALPLLRLHRYFNIDTPVQDPVEGLVVLVEHEGKSFALLVDEVMGQQQVVIKSLETNYRKVDGVAGATILGDGRVALILDVPGIIQLARTRPNVVLVA
jgi:two-component system chemotaxis sensor kinase CheA